jgi:hypothetical protein
MSEGAKLTWMIVAAVVLIVGAFFLSVFFVKIAWNVGMPTVASHLGLAFHRISYHAAFSVWFLLALFGGPLVGWNTMTHAKRSDVRRSS